MLDLNIWILSCATQACQSVLILYFRLLYQQNSVICYNKIALHAFSVFWAIYTGIPPLRDCVWALPLNTFQICYIFNSSRKKEKNLKPRGTTTNQTRAFLSLWKRILLNLYLKQGREKEQKLWGWVWAARHHSEQHYGILQPKENPN